MTASAILADLDAMAKRASEPCILGVDPGISGAIAFFFPRADRVAAEDVPVMHEEIDAATLSKRIMQMRVDGAILELAGARPGQGVSSMFKYGRAFGTVIGVLAALNVPVHYVTAAKWKKHLRLSSDKEASRALALRLWPASSEQFRRRKDHGRAEAALIARYGAERIWHGLVEAT